MAKTKKKSHYYVLVCTDEGAKFVTGWEARRAFWDVNKKPLEMSMSRAEDMAYGLNLGGFNAYVVKHPYEINYHPYNYDGYECVWKRKEVKNDEK